MPIPASVEWFIDNGSVIKIAKYMTALFHEIPFVNQHEPLSCSKANEVKCTYN